MASRTGLGRSCAAAKLVAMSAAAITGALAGYAQQTIGNLSTRSQVGPGDQVIRGFVIEGAAGAPILIRGVGPTLAQFGVANPLMKPMLTLFNSRGETIAQNLGWSTRPAEELTMIKRGSGAFLLPDNGADCGFYLTLTPGAYTVRLSGAANSGGVGLVELYSGNGFGNVPQNQPHLINLSSPCLVGVGDATAITGMFLPTNRRLLIRAIGPSLGQFGCDGCAGRSEVAVYHPRECLRVTERAHHESGPAGRNE